MPVDALLPLLRCPACEGRLDYESVVQRDAEAGECGLLRCGCAVYPVLDGVPILRGGALAHRSIADARVMAEGDAVEDVVARVAEGHGLDALVRLLTTPFCPWPLNRIGAFRRLSLREPLASAGLAVRRERTRRRLSERGRLTAEDWLSALYWHGPVSYDPFNYFFFRFGQPRHLATLALASALPDGAEPILDLACGYGHVLHTLTAEGRPAVGVEQNFHQAWVARHYVAPGAEFVCADADAPLPFRDDAFAGALCTDAFHYFEDKQGALDELRRCADGPVLLATTGNDDVEPREGNELTPDGYAALFGDSPWRVLTEADLLGRYLDGLGPALSASSAPEAVAEEKWLYYVVDGSESLFRDYGPFQTWPHESGVEAINPIYERSGDRLSLRFPSPWFAFENRGMRAYMPETATVSESTARDLRAGAVRVGLPRRYARPQGRPATMAANRAVSAAVAALRQ